MGRDIPACDVSHYVHFYPNKLTRDVIARDRVKLRHWPFGIPRETDDGDFDGDFESLNLLPCMSKNEQTYTLT